MAGFFRLHNKFHRSSHHTLSSLAPQDQGCDPIASKQYPFNGIFYNNLTDNQRSYDIPTNSYEWYSTYFTVCSLSANWDSIGTTYKTVCALSANWSDGYSAYLTLNALSANFQSTYTTVCAYSAAWGDNANILFTNKVQENTRSKTFSGYTLGIKLDNTVDWNLDIAQVAYLKLDRNVAFNNPTFSTLKRGGLYNLYIIQGPPVGGYTVNFDSRYKFPVGFNPLTDINYNLSGVTVINFICDGNFMFGDLYKIDLTPTPTPTKTPTPTPSKTPLIIGNGIITLVDGIQIERFDGSDIYPLLNLTPTPTPTATPPLNNITTLVDNVQIESFNNEDMYAF
jgi:hypothetical protein